MNDLLLIVIIILLISDRDYRHSDLYERIYINFRLFFKKDFEIGQKIVRLNDKQKPHPWMDFSKHVVYEIVNKDRDIYLVKLINTPPFNIRIPMIKSHNGPEYEVLSKKELIDFQIKPDDKNEIFDKQIDTILGDKT